ncbi:GNAT family N-acetyltransferase [soil metagenome]
MIANEPIWKHRLALGEFTGPRDLVDKFDKVDVLLIPSASNSLYAVGFASSNHCIDLALRLRYEVFNEELGEGLMASRLTGMDRDEFDEQMHHLVLIELATDTVIGTYRLQPAALALQKNGLYSARQYDLARLEPIIPLLVETGRACIAREFRQFATVKLLWKAIAAYMVAYRQRWIFGCCSLTTIDPDDGWRALRLLRDAKGLGSGALAMPVPTYSCGDPSREFDPTLVGTCKIPKLFSAYLRLGAEAISYPAIDREFGTVDFLVLLDAPRVNVSSIMMR